MPRSSERFKKKESPYTGILFALVFAIGFPVAGYFGGIAPLYRQAAYWWSARSYVPVPARVESAELVSTNDSESGTLYSAKASFRYEFQGRQYLGRRASFSGGSDNVGDFHQRLHAKLNEAQQRQLPVQLWVDPEHPERSVYDRTIRWQMLLFYLPFAFLFPAVGIGAWAGIAYLWHARAGHTLADMIKAGQAPRLRAFNGRPALLVLALFWNVVGWPVSVIMLDSYPIGFTPVTLFSFLFPALGAVLLCFSVHWLWKYWVAGTPELEITGVAPLRGRLHFRPGIGARLPADEAAHRVTLDASLVQEAGEADDAKPTTLWTQRVLDQQVARGTESLAFEVAAPADREDSKLEITLQLSGAGFIFHLPRRTA